MLLATFEAGLVAPNGYLVADRVGGEAAIIDAPEGVTAPMVAQAREWQTPIRYLLTTHAHWDHFWDNAEALRQTGAKFGIHPDSAPLLTINQTARWGIPHEIEPSVPDFFLVEGESVKLGGLTLEILLCPGHCPGNVALFERRERVVFVGDVLFAGSIGRTDFPGCDHAALLDSIRRKLWPLGDDVKVLPGHGPATTIGEERRTNPFVGGE